MYFPFMRGKKFELMALRELSTSIVENEIIMPIVEPVCCSLDDIGRAKKMFQKAKMPYILIFNPQVGKLHARRTDLKNFQNSFDELLTPEAVPAFIMKETPDFPIGLTLKYRDQVQIAFIHHGEYPHPSSINLDDAFQIFIDGETSETYQASYNRGHKIIIKDGFRKKDKNADYSPETQFFSDIQLNYLDKGYSGFGDYLTVGKGYSDSGGLAHAVTIHLTILEKDLKVKIKHFVSDSTTLGDGDAESKYFEALKKLVDFGKNNTSVNFTSGFSDFLNSHNNKHFPGLGKAKGLSMRHHLELMQECELRQKR